MYEDNNYVPQERSGAFNRTTDYVDGVRLNSSVTVEKMIGADEASCNSVGVFGGGRSDYPSAVNLTERGRAISPNSYEFKPCSTGPQHMSHSSRAFPGIIHRDLNSHEDQKGLTKK